MKAVQIKKYGGNDAVEINENAPAPVLPAEHVLIEARAAGVNPADWKTREGYFKEMAPLRLPATLGGDVAGVIIETADGAEFKKGDEVFGQGSAMGGGTGAFAEFVSAETKRIAKKPKKAGYAEAAALPLAGISALDVILNKINISSGQKILIHGGAGGIGSLAIQLAKHRGAHVATTVSEHDFEFAKSLGADEIINYKTQPFEEIVKDYDAVLDTVGADTYKKSFGVLKKGGMIVSMLEKPDEELMEKFGVHALMESTNKQVNTENLSKLAELVDRGVIKVHVDRTFPLEQADKALEYQEHGHPRGKVVLKIK
ncbi:MAG: NADP-dependent oxidoreductase [Candidatus Diapherotrites archaeon]|nr:NADP-dependent oxidoreductase [Candidatus Diapherotrites archaeon]